MRVLILGATGVLGYQCCEVCKEHKHKIVGISFYKNIELAGKIKCEYKFSSFYPKESNVHSFEQLIEKSHPDIIINAISDNTVAAHVLEISVQKNIDVILANKEVLILKNNIYDYWLPKWTKQNGSAIIPLDSEHSALLQILSQNFYNYGGIENVKSYGICASGGPFYGKTIQQLKTVKYEDVFAHPVWNMGKYITINSSTMFNKFTEMWEAFYIMKGRIPNVFLDTTSNIHAFIQYKNDDCFIYRHRPTMKSHILDCLNYFSKKNDCVIQQNSFQPKFLTAEPFYKLFLKYKKYVWSAFFSQIMEDLFQKNQQCVESFLNKKISFYKIIKNLYKDNK